MRLLGVLALLGWSAMACVTPEEEPTAMIGVVAVYGTIAAKAVSGDHAAQKLWCTTLHEVDRMLHDTHHQELLPQERQSLVLKLEPMAKDSGFQPDAKQVTTLIDDAVAILGHKDSRTAQLSKCDDAKL